MMGVPLEAVTVRLGNSDFPQAAGSGGQFGANNSTSGVYAACLKLSEAVAARLGLDDQPAEFAGGMVVAGDRRIALAKATEQGPLVGEDVITYGTLDKDYVQGTFAAQFAEVGVDRFTGEVRVRRMLAVIDAGRVLNPLTARSQVIGAMTMGVGAALMEALAIDKRHGFFVNHDLGGYEVSGPCGHPAPGGHLPRPSGSGVVAHEGQGNRRDRLVRRRGRRCQRHL